jgi:hypothetical protein
LFSRRLHPCAVLLAALLLALWLVGCGAGSAGTTVVTPTSARITSSSTAATSGADSGDAVFAQAFADHTSGLEVEGRGRVQKLLSDDTSGERHQRFIVELASGQTLLIAHNIDIASRVPGLEAGDQVSFKGQYEWNAQGGTVHWTHLDPDGSHTAGWIEFRGKTYQ